MTSLEIEMNVLVTLKMEDMLENSVAIQNLTLEMNELKKEMNELKKANERNTAKVAILEANMIKEPMKCKVVELGGYKEGERVRIRAWLGVMENYLHDGNTSPEILTEIAQTCLEVLVAQD